MLRRERRAVPRYHGRMKRPLAAFAVLALVARQAPAAAEPPPSYEDFAGAAASPPVVAGPPAPTTYTTTTAPASGTVRARFTKRSKSDDVRVYRDDGSGRYVLVCSVPCTADLPPSTPLRIAVNDFDEPHDFVLVGDAGREVGVDVGPPKRGGLALGIVLTSVGGLTALTGLMIALVGATLDEDLIVPGFVTTGVGGLTTAGGISLIANRTREPRVWQNAADATRMRDTALLPRVSTPLRVGFSF